MAEIEKALELPDGSFIKIKSCVGNVGAYDNDPRLWKCLDVLIMRSDGSEELLCSIDFETQKKLRTLVFNGGTEPVFIQENGL